MKFNRFNRLLADLIDINNKYDNTLNMLKDQIAFFSFWTANSD